MTVADNNNGDRVGLAELQFDSIGLEGILVTGSVTSSTAATDYYPASQASDGNTGTSWVTDTFPGDYFNFASPPVLTIDLGSDVTMTGAAFWNYSSIGNRLTEMSLRFATEAEGTAGFGTSILYNPTFNPEPLDQTNQQDFLFSQLVTARYVELTALDNYYPTGGGDRVGFNEIQFATIPEPSTLLLCSLGAAWLLLAHRRRKR